MAKTTRIIRLEWENQDSLKIDSNLDGGEFVTILEMEENGKLAKLWPSVEAIFTVFCQTCIDDVELDMKA